MTDKALILAYQRGDTSALGELYERHKGMITHFICQRVYDIEVAKDLMQEVFIKVVQYPQNYSPIVKVTTWLCQIAKQRIASWYRTKNLQKNMGTEFSLNKERDVPLQIAGGRTPEEITETKMEIDRCKNKLEKMSDKNSRAVLLRDFNGYTYEEIAEIEHIKIGTVRSRIHRGRKLLQ